LVSVFASETRGMKDGHTEAVNCVCVFVCVHLYYATPHVSEHLLNVQDVGNYVFWNRLVTSYP